MNFTFLQINNQAKSLNAELNQIKWLVFFKQTNGCIKLHNEKTEEGRENWCDEWTINFSEEAIGEEVVEADHPGSWRKLQEKMLSKWNKVELFSQIYKTI